MGLYYLTLLADLTTASHRGDPSAWSDLQYALYDGKVFLHDGELHEDPTVVDEFFPGERLRRVHLYVRDEGANIKGFEVSNAKMKFVDSQSGNGGSPFSGSISEYNFPTMEISRRSVSGRNRWFNCHGRIGRNIQWNPNESSFPFDFRPIQVAEITYEMSIELHIAELQDGRVTAFKFDPKWKLKNGSD